MLHKFDAQSWLVTGAVMQLDVVIPTYNRQDLLSRTLDSLLAARVPPGLAVSVTVVDNNSKDNTRGIVEGYMSQFAGRLNYVFESRQGRTSALNAGIAATKGDLIGMIDDDEEVAAGWYECVHAAFSAGDVDFIGGPCVPRWGIEPPSWVPKDCSGVIGWIDSGAEIVPYNNEHPGMLMGGNAVLTRAIFEKIGPYSPALGRTAKRLLAGEDRDMYDRLLRVGARGFYRPDLIIYHYIPPERLTKKYYRQWCFWNNASLGLLDRECPTPVAYLGGVPRWMIGHAARATLKVVKGALGKGRNPAENFASELALWDLAGFFYGKHFYKPLSR